MTSRRAFLKGTAALAAGAALGPALPRLARAADAAPKRLLVFFAPNGMPPTLWTPPDVGFGWRPSPLLEAIAPIRQETLVLTGMQNLVSGTDHGTAHVLRCLPQWDMSEQPSFDHVVSQHLEGRTPLSALHLGSQRNAACREGFCSLYSRLSYASGGVPNDLVVSTKAVYRRLFGATSVAPSVLDAVREDLATFASRGSAEDVRRLDAFAEGLRSIERRVLAPVCAEPDAPPPDPGVAFGDDVHIRTMLDLAVAALQCDRTRVVTYVLADASANMPLDFLDITMGLHVLSHTQNWPELRVAGQWILRHFSYLVQRLAETPDVDGGRLLDNTYVLFTSEFGDGVHHDPTNLPILLAGGRGGPARGQHLVLKDRPLADLWLSMLHAFDVRAPTFGRDGREPAIDLG